MEAQTYMASGAWSVPWRTNPATTCLRSLVEFSVPQRTERGRNHPYDQSLALLEATRFTEPAIFRRNVQEQGMGINKDQVKGRAKEAEGKVQEVAGKIIGSEQQEAKGNAKKNLGELQARYGDIKEKVKDAQK